MVVHPLDQSEIFMATVRCFGPRILLLTLSLTVLCGIPLGCQRSAPAAPIVSSEKKELTEDDHRILQQFVDECLAITPGTEPFPKQFRIGSDTEGENALQPADVVMAQSFRICQYETTQELYELVMGSNPSRWPGKRNSVETITFVNAEDFCRKLSALLRSSKRIAATETVRLPTEVEWEYCCRAGTTTLFSFGDEATIASDKGDAASTLSEYAWHTGNAGGNDPPCHPDRLFRTAARATAGRAQRLAVISRAARGTAQLRRDAALCTNRQWSRSSATAP